MGQSEETEGAEFTPEQAKIVETLRDMQSEIADVKAELMAKLSESRQECDSLYRELSKVRDELITSKTERRVLSRWYEDVKAERDKLHRELVDVRSALAAATEERDSLRITLDAWEQADTKPHKRVAVTDVADHVVPPILHVGEPDPANHAKDAKLEFRKVVPTPEMIAACTWWDLVGAEKAICLKHNTLRTVAWRAAGDYDQDRWKYTDCPQPLKPHGMTWQQLDKMLADKAQGTQAAPVPAAVVPFCDKCHGCGGVLIVAANSVGCYNVGCRRTMTVPFREATVSPFHPYHGPCATDGACSHG